MSSLDLQPLTSAETSYPFYDAFISYGRLDSKAFAIALHQQLTQLGYRVWFDQNDIPLGVDYQKQIDQGIQRAHNFLFIISPHAANSPYCALEIAQAVKFNKRIVPLMHVEAIDRATWQARHPNGTEAEWQADQQAGLTTSVPQLNRAITRINWIFCREGIDDQAAAFAGLLAVFQRDRAYVEQHTALLTQALAWEQAQRQSARLLVGAARQAACSWLLQTFPDSQPPCLPTALHAEYIGESQKYADQWMTQVFLAYAEADRERQEQLRLQLLLAGVTVWSSRTDIQLGKDFQSEINRGIENADNLVILLSPQALSSKYCLQEIGYALKLNKRIIPLLIEPIELASPPALAGGPALAEKPLTSESVSAKLRQLQFLDFTDGQRDADQSLAKLLKRLRDEAQYGRDHKLLLVQALKWQRQQQNPSILLRGSVLRYYDAWARVAAERQSQQITQLQQQFLAASLAQGDTATLDVYLSCAAADLEFVRKLSDILQVQGKTTWFPAQIEGDADVSAEERQNLDAAQNVVLVLSPSWLAAAETAAALSYALSQNKRIFIVDYQAVARSHLPPVLSSLTWIDFHRADGDFLTAFGELYRLLESEPAHVRGHTQLLVRAKAWQEAGCEDSYLLRGAELSAAASWLRQAEAKTPQPTALQRQYVAASEALPRRRVRLRSLLWSTAAATALVFAARLLGLLQPLELQAYDTLLRLRPSEAALDERFLLVQVDADSGVWLRQQMKLGRYSPGIGTIPDDALAEALTTLSAAKPALIGLDFYRDFPASPALAAQLVATENLIGICKVSTESPEGEKPAELPLERVGFNNVVQDGEQFIRRHYLKLQIDPQLSSQLICRAEEALSLQLARRYLAAQGIDYSDPWQGDRAPDMYLGQVRVPQLWADGILVSQSAAYSPLGANTFDGYQSLINFRAVNGSALDFAPSVSLEALLSGEVPPEQIANRIVLIGYSDRTDRNADYYNTPYGGMPGVVLQAQMTSQLISAGLDRRPLIHWWPIWGETLWIGLWAGVGGWTVWRSGRLRSLVGWSLGGSGLLLVGGYGALAGMALWLPLVPPLLAAGLSGSAVAYLTYRVRQP